MERVSQWSSEEFGGARFGDRRLTRRLVAVAAQAARRPAGQITQVFSTSSSREGAFRLVENAAVSTAELVRASSRTCAQRSAGHSFVFVPVDGSSLNLTDNNRTKGTGVVGSRRVGARGLQVMTALAVTPDGTPTGLCGQTWWARKAAVKKKRTGGMDKRPIEQKETRHWLDVMRQVRQAFPPETGPRPWFQLDRGGDAWPVILDGLDPAQLFTVRATYDRRLQVQARDDQRVYLRPTLESQPVLSEYDLDVPSSGKRRARLAKIEIRTCQVTLDLHVTPKRTTAATLWAVLAREVPATVPASDKPIEWLLLTTCPVRTEQDARLVLFGYSQRWRIEEFHRLWKSGACNVEDNQLRDIDHIIRWATILASVALRLLRLTYLARTTPDVHASVELSPAEIKAIVIAREPKSVPPQISIAQAVRWLADLGGYTGYRSSGPPGALTIGRGLQRIEMLASVMTRRINDQW
jgi:Transposase DNA-binding/Transposase Tn5 dimerisation domain